MSIPPYDAYGLAFLDGQGNVVQRINVAIIFSGQGMKSFSHAINGAQTGSAEVYRFYEPLYDVGILDAKLARESCKAVVGTTEAGRREKDLLELPDEEVRKQLFNTPTLQTYWQIKWKILNGSADEESANRIARKLYFEFVRTYPMLFAKNTLVQWASFSRGSPRDFRYEFNEGGPLYRVEGGIKVYRTNQKTTLRLKNL